MNVTTYFFGCLHGDGHFLYQAGARFRSRAREVERYGSGKHIDGTLAPTTAGGGELAQGVYRLHQLDNGYTALAWWDRTHGDTRPGCNSVVLMEGDHTAEELIAALHQHWPTVIAHLAKAGVVLRPE